MSVAATTGPAPGWYPDPTSPAQLRWWNGAGWTQDTQVLPRTAAPEPAPAPAAAEEPAFYASTRQAEPAAAPEVAAPPSTDFVMPRFEAVDTSFVRDATSFVLELPEEDLGPAGPPPVRFSFRSRAADDLVDDTDTVLMYVSPLAASKSPLREAPPVVEEEPHEVVEDDEEFFEIVDAELVDEDEPRPAPAPEPEAEPAAATASAPKADAPRWTPPTINGIDFSTLGRPGRKTAIVAVAAASAALLTNIIGGSDDHTGAAKAQPAITAATKDCLKLWNTADSASASAQRITLGQFAGALAKVGRVAPLPGTLMEPNSCGLTVYDPGTDTNAVFVAGVKDTVGYLDETAYPRAAKQYGYPKSAAQANVTIMPDGTLVAKG